MYVYLIIRFEMDSHTVLALREHPKVIKSDLDRRKCRKCVSKLYCGIRKLALRKKWIQPI